MLFDGCKIAKILSWSKKLLVLLIDCSDMHFIIADILYTYEAEAKNQYANISLLAW